jgi:eukaryotic-like serine/threonine-protein kinase
MPPDAESLSARLARGPLAPFEALRWAVGIGAALNRLHGNGAVHGGLSPQLVIRDVDGIRLLPRIPEAAAARAYQAPEQIVGEVGDERSDVFAYGAILYELIAGRPAFVDAGAGIRGAILETEPSPMPLAGPVHGAMERVARDCLEKDPARRRQRVQNAVAELKLAARSLPRVAELKERARTSIGKIQAPRPVRPIAAETIPARVARAASRPDYLAPEPTHASRNRWALRAAVAVAVLSVAALAGAWFLVPRSASPSLRLAVTPPENATYPGTPSLSPDGRSLTFSATGPDGVRMLWLRPFESGVSSPIRGTERAVSPFWSPDGRQIAFFADQQLKTVRVSNGEVRSLCPAEATAGGGTWNTEGTILFAPGIAGSLLSIPANGGRSKPETTLSVKNTEHAHLWPQFLPDGQNFILFVRTDLVTTSGVYAGKLGRPDLRRVLTSEVNASFSTDPESRSSNGYLIYPKDGSLVAQAYRPGAAAPEGEPIELVKNVNSVLSLSLAPLSVSNSGVLAYQSLKKATRQLVWTDRSGKQLSSAELSGDWGQVRIASDGTHAVTARLAAGKNQSDLWSVDLNGQTAQLTDTLMREETPLPSPDGSRVVYLQAQAGGGRAPSYDIMMKPANLAARGELLFGGPELKFPTDWSRDGRFILLTSVNSATQSDVWVYSTKDRRAQPLLQTVYAEGYAALSPDGKWLAYQSNESGSQQVYVQVFDPTSSAPQTRWQISTTGGTLPRWRSDSGELYFLKPSGALMAVATHSNGDAFTFGAPQALFQTRPLPNLPCWYDVAPGGQRFLVNMPLEWPATADIQVLTSWADRVRR